jgi:DNA-binding protein YbaB
MYDKYKKLQDTLKNLLIRAGKDTGVIVEMSCDMKLKDVRIEDESLLNPAMKTTLEGAIRSAFEKAQTKAQEIATEKTKEILGFDPSDLSKMM